MRLALVYRSFLRTGSLPRTTVELARHLSQRHEVHVFSIGARTDATLAPDCTFHDVPVSTLGAGGSFSARELLSFGRAAARMVSADRFDAVHVCAPSTWVGDVLHVPGVVSGEARLQGISRPRLLATALRHPGNGTRWLIERRALANPLLRRIHVAAPSVRDDLVRGYGVDADDVLVVCPGVNLDEFRPGANVEAARAALGLNEPEGLVLLFCGSDFERKGLDRAIEGVAAARARTLLLVVGANADQERFVQLARRLGVADRVRFLGERSDVAAVYAAADAVVLPTRADVWGVTPIEAMACGVPPIVSAAAGSSVAVTDGVTGVVLPEPFRIEALAAAMDGLAADPARRARLGTAGPEAAMMYSWQERGRRIENDLIAVAEERRRAAPVLRNRGRRHASEAPTA